MIVVTGATGNIGTELVRLLSARGLELARYQREDGGTNIVTETVAALAGRPPRSFRDFATDFARELEPRG